MLKRGVMLMLLLLSAGTALAQPRPPGGPPPNISTKNPNDIVRRGGNAEVLLNDDGSITLTSTGPNNDSPTTTEVSAEDLEDVDDTRRNRRIERTDDRFVTLYKLTTAGEWQVNIGPDTEGKVYVYIFTLDPRECIRSYQFDAEEKVEEFSGGCA